MQTLTELDIDLFLKECALEAHNLPFDVRSTLYDFRQDSNREGFLFFQGLDPERASYYLATYGSLLGEPYSYVQEGNGKLFHDVTPYRSHETAISSKSSKIYLDFHTELVFHHLIPDYLLLFCIRGDRDGVAATYVSSIRESLDEIPQDMRKVLEQPLFLTGIDYSFGNLSTEKGNGKAVPVLYGDLSDPLLNFDPDLMVAKTAEADSALKKLREILFKNKHSIVLQAGDLIMIDNKRAVHGRSAFTPYYDGMDRYLQRLFITRDLTRAQSIFSKKERIITYSFS